MHITDKKYMLNWVEPHWYGQEWLRGTEERIPYSDERAGSFSKLRGKEHRKVGVRRWLALLGWGVVGGRKHDTGLL